MTQEPPACSFCGRDTGSYTMTVDIRVTHRTGDLLEIGEDLVGRRHLCRTCTAAVGRILQLPEADAPYGAMATEGAQLARRDCTA